MKFMKSASPSRSRSGPHGSSTETSGRAKGSGAEGEADAGWGEGSVGAARGGVGSGRGSSGTEDSSGGGVTGDASDSGRGSGCGSAEAVCDGFDGAAASADASAVTGGSAGGGEAVGVGATEASGGERSFIAACPQEETRWLESYAILASRPKSTGHGERAAVTSHRPKPPRPYSRKTPSACRRNGSREAGRPAEGQAKESPRRRSSTRK